MLDFETASFAWCTLYQAFDDAAAKMHIQEIDQLAYERASL